MANNRNVFRALSDGLQPAIVQALSEAGEDICDGMRRRLQAGGHVDTGELLDSIRYEIDQAKGVTDMRIYADAESDDGQMYAEFIENGTGDAHGVPGGREGTWRYQDRQGNWHTTDGMDADPFIKPSVDEVLPRLGEIVSNTVYDLVKYGKGANR